jgi:hypothetical protein
MIENTRLATNDQIDSMSFNELTNEVSSIDGDDRPLKLYALWCVEKAIRISKAKCNIVYLNAARNYVRGKLSPKDFDSIVKQVKNRWNCLRDGDRNTVEMEVCSAILAACTFCLSSIRNEVLWATYSSALGSVAGHSALAIARTAGEENFYSVLRDARRDQEIELRRIING